MPFGRPTPGWPISRPEAGHPQGIFSGFSYYQLVFFFINIVPLNMEFTPFGWDGNSKRGQQNGDGWIGMTGWGRTEKGQQDEEFERW
jgi:hypothetical protein